MGGGPVAADPATGDRAPRVLLYVQHLLGIGHLRRAASLARALGDAGMVVTVVSGGPRLDGVDVGPGTLEHLPALRAADRTFRALVDDGGHPLDAALEARRRDRLLAIYDAVRPDILVTELFPFGRRRLAFELEPLLARAHAGPARPLVVSSVRDVLVAPSRPERGRETIERVERFYDLVLVHGDPRFISLDETFPGAARIADRIVYTGYVVDPPAEDSARLRGSGAEVVVSCGGGAIGERLLETALDARAAGLLHDAPWRLLAGPYLPEERFRVLRSRAGAGATVERARPDFARVLAGARLSISHGGYNTVMEVLAHRVPAVVVPYAGGRETEQTVRARRLAARGAVHVVAEAALRAETLTRAARAGLAAPAPDNEWLDTRGRERTVAVLREQLIRRGLVS